MAVLEIVTRRAPRSHRRALDAFAAELLLRDPDGKALSHISDLSSLVRRAAEHVVDSGEVWIEHLGPVYDTDGVADVVKLFDDGLISMWSVASWLVSPEPDLADEKPINALRRGGRDAVVATAHQWASSLA